MHGVALQERGVEVHVHERGVPGNGQSGGESRIFRHAHDDPRLVEEACRSRAVFAEWSERLGVELVSDDGAGAIGPSVDSRPPVRLTFAVRGDAPVRVATLQDSSGVFGETGAYAAATPGRQAYGVGLSETTDARDDGSLLTPRSWGSSPTGPRPTSGGRCPGCHPSRWTCGTAG